MSNVEINKEHSMYINELGGTVAVAKEFGISPQAVSRWRKKGIPKTSLMFLREKYPHVFQKFMSS